QLAPIEEDLTPRVGGFVKNDDDFRFLDHLPWWGRSTDSRDALGQAVGKWIFSRMRSVRALVNECLGPRLKWNLAGFEIRRNVVDVLAATRLPDSGEVRMAVRQPWCRRGEVGLAIRSLWSSGRRDFHPLPINRHTNQHQNDYRRQNS